MVVPERPVLVAPDSFKGTFSAAQVAGAIGRGLERAGLMPPDLCPVADGGEGTLYALLPQLGGELIAREVRGPLGDPVRTGFGLIEDGGTAIVEMAMASGLGLVAAEDRDAWRASTYGTGELIAAAAQAGAAVIVVAVGGSATTDGGAGALEAIEADGGIGNARIVVLCDVRTPFEDAP
jgi:glycerate kinase